MFSKLGLFLLFLPLFFQFQFQSKFGCLGQNIPEDFDFNDLNSNSIDVDSPPFEFLRSNIWRRLLWHRSSDSGFDKNRHVTTTQLIEQAEFQSETREVVTEDGYILTLDRIGPKFGQERNSTEKKPAVLMFSGLFACGDTWLMQSQDKSLAFILANLNYDVWLANPRGCYYSRKHKWKNPNSVDYWDFSWHEMGIQDLKFFVDFILEETGHSKINYIGLSMGVTVNLVLLAERPEYNEKFNMSINFGAAAIFKHAVSPYFPLGARASQLPTRIFSEIATGGSQELFPKTARFRELLQALCANNGEQICVSLAFSFLGFDNCQLNASILPLALELYPSGSSLKAGLHYLQLIRSGLFRQYDHGRLQNLIKYRRTEPPNYNLANVKSRQFLFYSRNDLLVHPKDVKKLASGFSPLAQTELCRVKWRYFNHVDYIAAKDINLLVNERVIRILEGKSCWAKTNADDAEVEEDDGKDEESLKCTNQTESSSAQTQPGALQRVYANLNKIISSQLQTRISRRQKSKDF